jgi:hypothetical protein
MIARDDVVLTFITDKPIGSLKIAVARLGKIAGPQIAEILQSVVRADVKISYTIERSRFAEPLTRARDSFITHFAAPETMQIAAASKKTKTNDNTTMRRPGRPKKNGLSASA